ncbi:MAG: pyridoxal-phosphate dependent enzyme [Candidatus Sericytochromatia bacterium]|nr:pyridoxal-phosphate dependent enzyme [Candidatus Tanganyikabacteria bacterium]
MPDSPSAHDSPLLRRLPGLSRPRLPLAGPPTAVEPLPRLGAALGLADLWVKRDDLAGAPYGGNKVRKLEFLLADAKRRGAATLLAVGATGSNFVAATACYAGRLGLDTVALLADQPNAAYVRRNLLLGARWGARQVRCRGKAELLARRAWLAATLPRCYSMPLGGSSPVGTLGYADAALELAEQIAAGLLPMPAAVFVATGSMGTQAGLLLGFALAGLDVPVVGVPVMTRALPWRQAIARLHDATARLLVHEGALSEVPRRGRVHVALGHAGAGYARFTPEGRDLVRAAADLEGLCLDGTYTAKAVAGMAATARDLGLAGRPVLFWLTLNGRDLAAELQECSPAAVPAAFAAYFDGAPQPYDPG